MNFLSKEQNQKFTGTGEKNAQGQSLEEFLEIYNPFQYKNPSSTVDILVFTYNEESGHKNITKLLLIKRGNHPCIGYWATPGGFVEFDEDMDVSAARELCEETGIDQIEIEQFKSYGAYDRDPRTRIITTAYVALVPENSLNAQAADDASDACWFDIADEMISSDVIDEKSCDIYKLHLKCDERNLHIGAEVKSEEYPSRVLKNRTYKVINSEQIAADHGALILEAYHYVNKRIKEQEER